MSARDIVMAAAGASAPDDPYFKNVSLLLTGDGTNGAQNNTFLDSSTNNFTITRNGNTTQGTFSPYGNLWSNYFDGSGDYLNLAGQSAFAFGTGDFTIETWIYCISLSGAMSVFDFRPISTNGAYPTVYLNTDGSAAYYVSSADRIVSSAGDIAINTWNHIAISRSGTSTKMFINGVQKGFTYTDSNNYTVGASRPTIASNGYTIGSYFIGYCSNFRIVKGTAVYTSNFTPSTTPLTAVSGTSLLTCQSNRFKDNSSNNFTLTVNGNTSVQRFSPFNPTAPYSASTIGGSGYFDGTGDYLSVPSNAAFDLGSSNFTIEAFIYPLSFTNGYSIASRYAYISPTAYGWVLRAVNATTIRFVRGNDVILDGTTTINLNAWNHVAVSRSGSTLSIYVNGVRAATSTGISNFSDATSVFQSGATNTTTDYANGYISNLRVVKGSAVYDPTQSTITIPTAPLTAITNTSLLCNFTNAGIPDAAMMNDLETVGNAQVSTSVKKYGTGSMYFDGSGGWLLMPANTTMGLTGDFTIEFWYNLNAVNSYNIALGSSGTSPSDYIAIRASNIELAINDTSYPTWTATTSSGTWYHLAVVRQSGNIKIYQNGTALTLASGSASNSTVFLPITQGLLVGRYGGTNGGGYPINGYIDDLRITKGYARYTSSFTPPTAALPTN